MRIFFFCSCFLVWVFQGNAQTLGYHFSVKQGTYVELQGDTAIFKNKLWFNITQKVPIGFGFSFFSKAFHEVTAWNEALYFDYENEDYAFAPYEAYLCDRGIPSPGSTPLSPISYRTEGQTGKRIFKFQVKNAGFYNGQPEDFTNFQIWLAEEDQSIEIHFGPRSIGPGAWQEGTSGPGIGLFLTSANFFQAVEGSEAAPVILDFQLDDTTLVYNGIQGAPEDGRIYRFTPLTTLVNTLKEDAPFIELYPNPCEDFIRWKGLEPIGRACRILYSNGQTARVLNTSTQEADLSQLSSGVYWFQYEVNGTNRLRAFVKR